MSENPSSLTLKRNVGVKVIVTESYKKIMILELNQTITGLQRRVEGLKEALASGEGSRDYLSQLQAEKRKAQVTIEDLLVKIENAKRLEIGSEFRQGMIEGYATVEKGDNLYEKLASLEIVVKDGIIQDIIQSKPYATAPSDQ